MKVILMSRAERTREFSYTLLDLVNDFFVPYQGVNVACLSEEGAKRAVASLMYELMEGCDTSTPCQLYQEWMVWKQYLPTATKDAVRSTVLELQKNDGEIPKQVEVLVEERSVRIWGGDFKTQLVPVSVYGNQFDTERRPTMGLPHRWVTVKLMP